MGKEEALGYECRKGPRVHLSLNVVPAVVANRLNSHSKVILLPTNLSVDVTFLLTPSANKKSFVVFIACVVVFTKIFIFYNEIFL